MQKLWKSKSFWITVTALYVCVQTALGIALQVTHGRVINTCQFGAIILACLFCAVLAERSREYAFTQIALVCTVCADYFLVWSQPIKQLPAMLFFLCAQTAYAARLYLLAGKTERRVQLISRVALCAVIVIVTLAVLGQNADALAIVSMLYYAQLILNVVFAFAKFRSRAVLAIGFLLFLLCDTVIGLDLINGYLPIPPDALLYKIIRPGFNLAWVFYLPSQVLLSLSLLPKKFGKEAHGKQSV